MATGKGGKGVKVANAVVAVIPDFSGSRKAITEQLTPAITGASDEAGKKAGGSIGGKLSEGLSTAKIAFGNAIGNLMTSAITKVSGTIKNTFMKAFTNFGDYQQLVGGVETLFKESAGIVQQYARNAYRTAGLSANEYMENVTGFSASLIQSLGGDTEKAARIADVAMTDMSDNANKMGTAMNSITWAYQGFAKGNFGMLDNLKLGYGGTKKEMERLLADANALNAAQGKLTDYSLESFSDIVEAIHVVQENLGITGTTAEEAGATIQGSFNMVKASWDNFLTGIADPNANWKELSQQLVDSIKTAFKNAAPAVDEIIQGIIWSVGQLFEEAGWTEASEQMLNAFDNVKGYFGEFIEFAKANIIPVAKDIFEKFGDVFYNVSVIVVNNIIPAIQGFFDWLGRVGEAAQKLWSSVSESLMKKIEGHGGKLAELFQGALNGAPDLLTAIGDGIVNGIGWLAEHGDEIADAIIVIIDSINAVAKVVEAVAIIVNGAANFILETMQSIVDWIQNDPVGQAVGRVLNGLVGLITTAFEFIKGSTEIIFGAIVGIVTGDWSMMSDGVESITSGMKDLVTNLWEMLAGAIEGIVRNVYKIVCGIFDNVTKTASEAPQNIANAFQSLPGQIWNFIKGIPDMFARMFSQIHIPQLHVVGEFNLDPANFKIPSIKFYAEGGWVGRPTAIAGEAGNEVVLSERGKFTNRFASFIADNLERRGLGGDTYFVIDGAIINSDEEMERNFYNNMMELKRKAGMYV